MSMKSFSCVLSAFLFISTTCLIGYTVAFSASPSITGYKVCTSSTCQRNGSDMLLEALQSVATSDMRIKGDACLGGCCKGVVVKATGVANVRSKTLDPVKDESTALIMAKELLLLKSGGGDGSGGGFLNDAEFERLEAVIASGEQIFSCDAPELCSNCGSSIQLYRGNCAKCGKYPY